MEMKILYDLEKEGISNSRIVNHIASLILVKDKNDYCATLIDRKRLFTVYFNQCKQLKLRTKYDPSNVYKNLDSYELKDIQGLVDRNIALGKTILKPGSEESCNLNSRKTNSQKVSGSKRGSNKKNSEKKVKKAAKKTPKKDGKKKPYKNPFTKIIYVGHMYN